MARLPISLPTSEPHQTLRFAIAGSHFQSCLTANVCSMPSCKQWLQSPEHRIRSASWNQHRAASDDCGGGMKCLQPTDSGKYEGLACLCIDCGSLSTHMLKLSSHEFRQLACKFRPIWTEVSPDQYELWPPFFSCDLLPHSPPQLCVFRKQKFRRTLPDRNSACSNNRRALMRRCVPEGWRR